MYKIILTLTLAFVMSATPPAQTHDDVDHPSEQLQNLIFYPHKGQFLLAPQLSLSLHGSSQSIDNSGVQTSATTAQYQELSGALTYGLTHRLRLQASESWYLVNSSSATKLATGAVTTNATNGPTNPTFTAAYRYFESAGVGLHADLSFAVSPSIGPKMVATAGQTGTASGGPWTTTLSDPLYYFCGTHEFGLIPTLGQNYGGAGNGTTQANSNFTSPYWTESLAVEDRVHLTESLYLQPQLTMTLPYTYSSSSQTPNATNTGHNVDAQLTPSLALGYLASSAMLLSGSINYSNSINNSYPASANNSQSKASSVAATVQGRFLF